MTKIDKPEKIKIYDPQIIWEEMQHDSGVTGVKEKRPLRRDAGDFP